MRGGRPFSKRAARSVSAGAPCPPPRPSIMLPSSFARAPTSHEQGKKKKRRTPCFLFSFVPARRLFLQLFFCDGKYLHFLGGGLMPKAASRQANGLARNHTTRRKTGACIRTERNRRRDRKCFLFSLLRKRGKRRNSRKGDWHIMDSRPHRDHSPGQTKGNEAFETSASFFVPSLSLSVQDHHHEKKSARKNHQIARRRPRTRAERAGAT